MELISTQSAVFLNLFPACGFYIGKERSETFGERLNKLAVDLRMMSRTLALEQILQNAFDGRYISIDAHGEIQIGKCLAIPKQCKGQLQRVRIILGVWIRYPHQAHFR